MATKAGAKGATKAPAKKTAVKKVATKTTKKAIAKAGCCKPMPIGVQ